MSFNIFLSRFVRGDNATFPRGVVDEVLGPYVVQPTAPFGSPRLVFPDRGGGFCDIDEGDEITGIGVNRPGGLDLYRALYEILRQTPTAVYWGSGVAITDPAVIPDLPPEMIEALGQPVIVHSGDELFALVTRGAVT